jgi:hypothetical protein
MTETGWILAGLVWGTAIGWVLGAWLARLLWRRRAR